VPGGKASSLPKERGFLSRLPPGQYAQESCPAPLCFSGGKIPPQRGQRCRRDRPLPKPLRATAALIQARRAKLSSASKESLPSLDPRIDAT
jgi:hypothetical protein